MPNISDIFPLNNSWLLVATFLLSIAAIVLNVNNKDKTALLLLFFAAIAVRLFAAHLDPFLHEWDERYHALVARNMMHDPFKPMLIAHPYTPYDYKYWCGNYIWLHKQPLFLWQMALSMKLFGVSEFTIRYPSVLMGALSVLLIYRVTVLGTQNRKIAFIAALLTCYSYLALDMTSGQKGIDHNDLAFQFYVLSSIWAFAEYSQNRTMRWAVAAGVLSGCAVLNKWLPGLLVFAGWAINILFDVRKGQFQKKEAIHFFAAVCIAFIVFVPWQLYTLYRFPAEARYELNYNSEHILKVVEGHSGDGWYYLNLFHVYFGNFVWVLVIIGLACIGLLKQYHNPVMSALVVNFFIVFVFFSFIVPTKMDGFFMVVVPFGYVFMAIAAVHILTGKITVDQSGPIIFLRLAYDNALKRKQKYAFGVLIMILVLLVFNLGELTENHDPKNNRNSQYARIKENKEFKSFAHKLPRSVQVIINAQDGHNIDIMFYNNNLTAYPWCLTRELFDQCIKSKNITIAVFATHGPYVVPDYITDYPNKYMITGVY